MGRAQHMITPHIWIAALIALMCLPLLMTVRTLPSRALWIIGLIAFSADFFAKSTASINYGVAACAAFAIALLLEFLYRRRNAAHPPA